MSGALKFRLFAVALLLAGGGMVGSNVWQIERQGSFSLKLFVFGCAVLLMAPLWVVTGQPIDPETGKPPRWWNVASSALFILGGAAGAAISFAIEG